MNKSSRKTLRTIVSGIAEFLSKGTSVAQDADTRSSTSVNHTCIREVNTQIQIWKNGELQHISVNQEQSAEELARLADQLGIPLSVLEQALGGAVNEVKMTHTQSVGAGKTGPLIKIQCIHCKQQNVSRQSWCMYCGHELPDRNAQSQAIKGAGQEEQFTEEIIEVVEQDPLKIRLQKM